MPARPCLLVGSRLPVNAMPGLICRLPDKPDSGDVTLALYTQKKKIKHYTAQLVRLSLTRTGRVQMAFP